VLKSGFLKIGGWESRSFRTVANDSTFMRVESSWNVTTHGYAREEKWRGNWRMEWLASTLHTTSEHGVSSITAADAHSSAASSRLNWHPRRFKWTCQFRRKTKSGFCACAIMFQTQSTTKTVGKKTPLTSRGAPYAAFLFSEWNTPPSVSLVALHFSLLYSTVKTETEIRFFLSALVSSWTFSSLKSHHAKK